MEAIYQQVWIQVFSGTCVRLHAMEQGQAINTAEYEANWAAREAVLRFSNAMQDDALAEARKSGVG
jgi:hypothetical protein